MNETLAWLDKAGRWGRLEAASERLLGAFLEVIAEQVGQNTEAQNCGSTEGTLGRAERDEKAFPCLSNSVLQYSPEKSHELTAAVRAHREAFLGSPHVPSALFAALSALPGEGETWSFKTTGAGGEDALLLIGPRSALAAPDAWLRAAGWQPLPAAFETAGVRITRAPLREARHG